MFVCLVRSSKKALVTAKRSKDPKTQVGCAIVDGMGVVVSVGYNGMPISCGDDASVATAMQYS